MEHNGNGVLILRRFPRSAAIMVPILCGVALLYHQTMAPTVTAIDSGELATVQAFLGIAHPTGYPLFTLLGSLFLKLPLGGSVICRLNLLSLLLCTAALGLLYRAFERITDHEVGEREPSLSWVVPGAAVLFVAFNRTFWDQSSMVEVHALQLVLVAGILCLILRLSLIQYCELRGWLLVVVVLALGFSNHMTTVVLVPGILYVLARNGGFSRGWLRRIGSLAVLFCIIIASTYAFLPVRASQEPVLNWGNPSTFARFLRHVSGAQYRVWFFSSSETALKNFLEFTRTLPSQFGYSGFIIGLVGIAVSFRRRTRYQMFLFITFSCSVLYAINYDIHDLDAYFLPAYLVFGVWTAMGLTALLLAARRRAAGVALLSIAVVLGIGLSLGKTAQENDRSRLFVFEDYTKGVLASLPHGAILLTYQWDFLVSPAYYTQLVERFRDDVVIIDKELLRRSWYFDQLRTAYPGVIEGVKPEVDRFVEAVIPFEENRPHDARLLEHRYRTLITRLIAWGAEKRTVFIGPELVDGEIRRGEIELPRGYAIVPDLLAFRVVSSPDYMPVRSDPPTIRFPASPSYYSGSIRSFVGRMLLTRALYEMYHGREEATRSLVDHLKSRYPEVRIPDQLRVL